MKTVKTSIESLLPIIEESFHNNQDISLVIKGTSMSPTFIDNKTVVSLQQFNGTLQKNHIYLYKVQDTTLLHRYIKTKAHTHMFRGDNCINYEYVDIKDIIGEVIDVNHTPFKFTLNTIYHLSFKKLKEFIRKLIRG